MTPWLDDGDVQLYHGDALTVLARLAAGSVQTVVTSPPYWGLRDYGTPGQLGLEATPDAYVAAMVAVFAEVRRVLATDGTVWLNLGDSYVSDPGKGGSGTPNGRNGRGEGYGRERMAQVKDTNATRTLDASSQIRPYAVDGLAPKNLVGIPWRVAFALQADGWYLRSDIIWSKPNPMPESVTDRPTKAHEYVFLLSKQPRYYWDYDAVREDPSPNSHARRRDGEPTSKQITAGTMHWHGKPGLNGDYSGGRNCRSVWTVATQPTPDLHFATMPEALVRPCVLAGSREGDTVLDPFIGSGTTALVARKHGRRAIGIDLSEKYLEIAARRLGQQSLFAEVKP